MRNLTQNLSNRTMVLLLFMALVAAARVATSGSGGQISALSNFSPVGAMALFGGAYFSRYKSFLFPLLTLWVSDLLLNRLVFYGEWRLFYEGFYWTYGAFALMVLVGKTLLRRVTIARFISAAILTVAIHWVVTDIGVWLSGMTYPQTAAGFWACLVAAIPFERNLLVGTVTYGALMFGLFEWMKAKQLVLKPVYANQKQQ